MQHALLVEDRQAGGCQAPDSIGLRTGFFGQQFGGDDAGGITYPFDFHVWVGLFERLLVALQLLGFEGGVNRQLGFGSKRINTESGEDSSDKSKRLEHGAVP